MRRLLRLFGDESSLRLALTLALNVFFIATVVALRYTLPSSFQQPTLDLPSVSSFSIANWLAGRLADLVTIIEEILRHLIR